MTLLRLTLVLAVCWLGATPARADEVYLLRREVETDFVGSRTSRHGLSNAEAALRDLIAGAQDEAVRAARDVGGRVVAATTFIPGLGDDDVLRVDARGALVRDGAHELFRRRATVDALILAPGPVPGALRLEDRSLVQLSVSARDAQGRLEGRPQHVEVTVAELAALRDDPVAAGRTALGALLRRAWQQASSSAREPDVQPLVELHLHALVFADGQARRIERGQLSRREADLLLGRSYPFVERVRRRLGIEPKPGLQLDDAEAAALASATGAPSPTREQLLEVRTRRGQLRPDDRALLRGLGGPRRGLVDVIPGR